MTGDKRNINRSPLRSYILGSNLGVPEKQTSTSALLTMPKSLTVWITENCRKF